MMKLTVLRPFLVKGQRQEIGAVLDIDDRVFAASLIHEGKAEYAEEVEASGLMTTDTAPGAVPGKALRAGKAKKESHDHA